MSQFVKQAKTQRSKNEDNVSVKTFKIDGYQPIKILHVQDSETFNFKWAFITTTVNLSSKPILINKSVKNSTKISLGIFKEKEFFFDYFSIPLEETSIEDHINSLLNSKKNEKKGDLFIRICKIIFNKKLFICDCKNKECKKAEYIFELCSRTIERIIQQYIQEEKCKICNNSECLELCKICFKFVCSKNSLKCKGNNCNKLICKKGIHEKKKLIKMINSCEHCDDIFCFPCFKKHKMNNAIKSQSCSSKHIEENNEKDEIKTKQIIDEIIDNEPILITSESEEDIEKEEIKTKQFIDKINDDEPVLITSDSEEDI